MIYVRDLMILLAQPSIAGVLLTADMRQLPVMWLELLYIFQGVGRTEL